MKKKIIIGLFLLIISTAGAILYSTRDEARNALLVYIQNINLIVDQTMSTITYTSEGNCTMTEIEDVINDICKLCFEFDYDKIKIEKCILVSGNKTDKEIDNDIRFTVKEFIRENYPSEEFKYRRTGFLGREIQSLKESADSELYKCSTKPSRIETCVCISGTRCYYEICGESPWGVCMFGEWVKV